MLLELRWNFDFLRSFLSPNIQNQVAEELILVLSLIMLIGSSINILKKKRRCYLS